MTNQPRVGSWKENSPLFRPVRLVSIHRRLSVQSALPEEGYFAALNKLRGLFVVVRLGNSSTQVGPISSMWEVEMTIAGGWSKYSTHISSEAKTAFDEAVRGLTGVSYAPIAVAEQVVAGKNYRFFCNAQTVVPNSTNDAAIVSVYKPLEGNAELTGTQTIGD